jgi:hypothetical protein
VVPFGLLCFFARRFSSSYAPKKVLEGKSNMKQLMIFVAIGLLLTSVLCCGCVATTRATELTPQQKEIVQYGRYVEYMAANYGGSHNDSAFLTVEQSTAFINHLSTTYNIPEHYFTDGTWQNTQLAGYMPNVTAEDGTQVPLTFY